MCGGQNRFNEAGAVRFTALAGAVFALLMALYAPPCVAQNSAPEKFSSPVDACHALYAAVNNDDESAMMRVLGSGKELISLEDKGQDKLERERFIAKYREMHRLVREPDGTTFLYIGAENWPFPVPLVSSKGAWYFDSKAGAKEVLFRRIGENEEAAIQASHLLVLAQKRYREASHDPTGHYALKFVSDSGTHDGLYAGDNSPIPDFVAKAGVSEGAAQHKATPYAGYYFRILSQQGKAAPGGAQNYLSNGELTKGFAFVAYPAEYGRSGVMTFILSRDDVLYEKDLGPGTATIVQQMTRYNPGPGWRRTE